MRIPYNELYNTFFEILMNRKVEETKAKKLAQTIADSTLDGVVSHGVNRFSNLIGLIDNKTIDIEANPSLEQSFGAMEQWNGCRGFGIINAHHCMQRAIELSKENGVGVVALKNTNHWLRGGSYGWQAADAGCIGLCWTNTMPNMPAWGAKDCRLGNNPMVIAIPRDNKHHVVLDMAMTQFSYGNLTKASLDQKQLSIDGGFNLQGELTKDPDEILASKRILQTGFWKGSGLSLVLDLMASCLANGKSVENIGELPQETGLSQVFMAVDVNKMTPNDAVVKTIEDTLAYMGDSDLADQNQRVRYPGERAFESRQRQFKEGIEVNDEIWEEIANLI